MAKTEEVVLDDSALYEEVVEPHTIETGDILKVKQVLDDATIEALAKAGYEVNYSWDNFKILLMFIACGFALLGQFYPMPFPSSRLLLGGCVAAYATISGVLQYIVIFVDRDTIALTKPHKESGEVLQIRTEFPRFQEYFKLTVQGKDKSSPTTVANMYVGRYFTEIGEFDQDCFAMDVINHIKRYEAKKYMEFTYDHKSD